MYKVNIDDKKLTKLSPTDFASNNLLERYDIQEWIEKTPEILGEELLIIGKELLLPSNSRLDLLAIDKNAKLVIIELKRDDSGKNIDWQAIKYTSYCSNFLVDEIIIHFAAYLNSDEDDAKNIIKEFINEDLDLLNHSQRIVLVSKEYHSDVISAVLWLRDYGVDIECLRIQPFLDETNSLFIHPSKIIPLPEAKDYIVKKERKQKEIKRAQGNFEKGEILETVYVSMRETTYKINRYDSTSITIYNIDLKKEEIVYPLLKEINDQKNLDVDILNANNNKKNTRTLGKDIIMAIKNQNKEAHDYAKQTE